MCLIPHDWTRRGEAACRSREDERQFVEGAEGEGRLLDWPNEEKETVGNEEDGEGRVGIALLRQEIGLDTNRAKFNIAGFFLLLKLNDLWYILKRGFPNILFSSLTWWRLFVKCLLSTIIWGHLLQVSSDSDARTGWSFSQGGGRPWKVAINSLKSKSGYWEYY